MINITEEKIHLHHSHVTDKIGGYSHSFCNMKVREETNIFFPLFSRNLFHFDFFFVRKGIRLCVLRTKNLCIDVSYLADIKKK